MVAKTLDPNAVRLMPAMFIAAITTTANTAVNISNPGVR